MFYIKSDNDATVVLLLSPNKGLIDSQYGTVTVPEWDRFDIPFVKSLVRSDEKCRKLWNSQRPNIKHPKNGFVDICGYVFVSPKR